MSYSSEVLADSPLVWLRLDETSGTTAADSSGNARDMTSANCTVNQATVMPGGTASYDFNGSSSQISLADAAWQRPAAFTVEAWIRADAVNSFRAVGAKDGSGAGWAFYIIDNKLSLYTNGTAHTDTTTALSTGTVYHVAATYDSGNIKLYVNGSQVASFTGASLTQTSGTALLAGVSTGSNGGASRFFWFDGRIDEWAYYGAALSGARLAAHYTAGNALSASGSAALSLSASGGATAPAAGSASLSLSASGSAVPPGTPASGAASLSLSASGGAGAPVAGSASLSLAASGASSASPAGLAFLTLGAGGLAQALYRTAISNFINGRRRGGRGTAEVAAAYTPPAGAVGVRVDKAVALPDPVLVDGRPT